RCLLSARIDRGADERRCNRHQQRAAAPYGVMSHLPVRHGRRPFSSTIVAVHSPPPPTGRAVVGSFRMITGGVVSNGSGGGSADRVGSSGNASSPSTTPSPSVSGL